MPPRSLERAVTIPLPDSALALEGIFLAAGADAERAAVVAPPHPLYGGSMENPVVCEIAYACEKGGLASLRFNWRGVGASAGTPSGEASDADEDYAAASLHLEETVSGPLVAAGYSFGAASAVRVAAARARLQRLLLVSPPPQLLDADALAACGGRVLLVTGERDAIAPPGPLEQIADRLPDCEFRAIPEADHFFMAGLAAIGRAIESWV